MKHALFAILACALVSICLCGKDSDNGTGPSASENNFIRDTSAVRALLDSNGLTTVSYAAVTNDSLARVTGLMLLKSRMGGGVIHTIPSVIGNLSELVSISFDNNQVTTLPASIGNLKKLTVITGSGNLLTQLPSTIGQCSNLTSLILNGNQISSLPSTIGSLTNLLTLQLSGNQLTALPSAIGTLTKLQVLYIDQNLITAAGLPPSMASITALGLINVDGNHICNLTDAGLINQFNNFAESDWSTQQTCP